MNTLAFMPIIQNLKSKFQNLATPLLHHSCAYSDLKFLSRACEIGFML